MEENKPQKQTGWIRSWWTRGVAAFLAVAMTCTIVLANAVRIQLGSDGESASEQALSETTDYINKNPLARAGDVITRFFTNPQTLEQYYQNASVLIGAGQYEQALGLINICITMADASDAALLDELWLKRGCLETLTGAYDDALESFTHISPGVYANEQLLIRAQIYSEQGDTQRTAEALDEYVARTPEEFESRSMLAHAYIQLER